MNGCNNFCTFCIVPHVRGRERSRSANDITAEIGGLINDGFKDIMLLGQNVNSYGKELGVSFSELLRRLDGLDGEFKISFMTSHPKDATHELIDTIAESRHISHHLLLPVQSGSDRILKAYEPHYDRAKYMEACKLCKKQNPDLRYL